MRFVAFSLFIAVIAIVATGMALENPGYVLIARAPWSIEMPLTLFVPLLAIAFLLFMGVLYTAFRLTRIPHDVARWRARRSQRASRQSLVRGLTHLAEGSWAEAEAALHAAQRHGDAPLLAYLGAACAAQGLNQTEKRDEYLAAAHRVAPRETLAIGTVQAYLQHLAHQQEQSLATLSDLHGQRPRHRHTLKLLANEYARLRDWPSLLQLLPEVRRQAALSSGDISDLELRAHRDLLMQPLPAGSADVLARAWNAVPKNLRRHPSLVAIYARQLIQQGEMSAAEQTLKAALESSWDDVLVELYGQIKLDNARELLDNTENWLAVHADNPKLLLALGRLASRAGEVTKARGFLERSAALRPAPETFLELGQLLERLGESTAAMNAFRRGIESGIDDGRAGARLYRLPTSRNQATN